MFAFQWNHFLGGQSIVRTAYQINVQLAFIRVYSFLQFRCRLAIFITLLEQFEYICRFEILIRKFSFRIYLKPCLWSSLVFKCLSCLSLIWKAREFAVFTSCQGWWTLSSVQFDSNFQSDFKWNNFIQFKLLIFSSSTCRISNQTHLCKMNYGPPQPGFNVTQQQPPFAAPGGYPYPPPNQGGYMPTDQNIPMLGPGKWAWLLISSYWL